MTDWLILTEGEADLRQSETPHKVMRIDDYLTSPGLFHARRPYILNLARSYSYQSEGYYASLLAEARGHRVVPAVQTMVELSAKSLYAHALPELGERLRQCLAKGAEPVERILIAFSRTAQTGYERFAREVSDWFRAPILEVTIDPNTTSGIARIRPLSPAKIKGEDRAFLLSALADYTRGRVALPKNRPPAKWALAILTDPRERTPPSDAATLKRLITVAAKHGVDAEIIGPGDLTSLAEFDALFIRATTSIDNFTYKFARRAEQEGMPVIDDTMSMIRCTNKVYMQEVLQKAGLPTPATEILDQKSDLAAIFERLGSPVILKTPDGSFGTNMVKAKTLDELKTGVKTLLKDTALIIAQAFMPTKFDWRVGVLGGEALYVCQYRMARGHWQIVKHGPDGKMTEGGAATFPVSDAPPEVVELGVRAAGLIGDGFYGIDIKETETGLVVIEINDNPSVDLDVEAVVIKDDLLIKLFAWYSKRLERRILNRA